MSTLYFHTPDDTAELHGAEYAWMRHLAVSTGGAAWDINDCARARYLLELVPEPDDTGLGENYLHRYLREAQTDVSLTPRLLQALSTVLSGSGLPISLYGRQLHTHNLTLNTALTTGSDPIVLAAKIHAWGPRHAWIDGPHRAWLADIIETGLHHGIYRSRMGWKTGFPFGIRSGVLPLLRGRKDEPVVLAYSVDTAFPNSSIAHNGSILDEDDEHAWEQLTHQQQWNAAFAGLRARRPWAQITPDNFRTQTFGPPVTIHDLFRNDRADHLRNTMTALPLPTVTTS